MSWPVLVLALSAAALGAGLLLLVFELQPLPRRARALAGRAGQALRPGQASPRVADLVLRVRLPAWLPPAPVEQLQAAGYRGRFAPLGWTLGRLLAPIALASAGCVLGPFAFGPDRGHLLGLAAGGLLGIAAPRLWLRRRIFRRRGAIRAGFPDMLDLFVICVESGLSIDATIARVAAELRPAWPDLADEIGLAALELGFLPDRAEALSNLERRVPIPEVRSLVAMLRQTERFGTPLAEALRAQAAEARATVILRVEEQAQRLPAVLAVPVILLVLPPLFIVLLGPVVLRLVAS
ncbi:type II secretion system F family protein [Thermaurantiacus sp.]